MHGMSCRSDSVRSAAVRLLVFRWRRAYALVALLLALLLVLVSGLLDRCFLGCLLVYLGSRASPCLGPVILSRVIRQIAYGSVKWACHRVLFGWISQSAWCHNLRMPEHSAPYVLRVSCGLQIGVSESPRFQLVFQGFQWATVPSR